MPDLAHDTLQAAFASTPLFADKSWQLSPAAWPLTVAQVTQLEAIGTACFDYHQALETLYLRSAAGKNLLRNKPLLAPWVADYLDRGKPSELLAHARAPRNRGAFPAVLRPDLLLTDDGFALTELDSVPGGIGLTAFLNRLYSPGSSAPSNAASDAPKTSPSTTPSSTAPLPSPAATSAANPGTLLGAGDLMIRGFYEALTALCPGTRNPLIAIVVSDEAATYRPEMYWLAEQLQRQGRRVFCLTPGDIFPLGSTLCFDVEGNPEKIDLIYRFFELFDLGNLSTAAFFYEAWAAGEVVITPPMRPYQEEKLGLALFHHPRLHEFWIETLTPRSHQLLRALIPASWVIDPAPLPPGAVLDGPRVGGRPLNDWLQLANASQKERDLILKISGFHETAWGARSVLLGSDCSREEWQGGIEHAVAEAALHPFILQEFKKPRRTRHRLYDAQGTAREADGRLRLCPYYFIQGGRAVLSGALATFCPPDKKIIHGMQDAALLPCQVVPG